MADAVQRSEKVMTTPPLLQTPPSRLSRRVLPWMLVAVVLAGLFLVFLQLKPQWEEARVHVRQQTELLSVRNNLIQIGSAADTYFEQESAKEEVTVPELRIWLSGALHLEPVEGEDYDSIVVPKKWQSISLQLPSGRSVDWTRK